MRRHLAILSLFLAWLCANGAVWNVVQLVAWAKMFHANAQVMSTAQALQTTFDGSKPCNLCHVTEVAQNTAREQLPQEAALGGADKVLLAFHVTAPLVLLAPETAWPGVVHDTGSIRIEAVPVPPPRA